MKKKASRDEVLLVNRVQQGIVGAIHTCKRAPSLEGGFGYQLSLGGVPITIFLSFRMTFAYIFFIFSQTLKPLPFPYQVSTLPKQFLI